MQKIKFTHGGKEYDDNYPDGIPTSVELITKDASGSPAAWSCTRPATRATPTRPCSTSRPQVQAPRRHGHQGSRHVIGLLKNVGPLSAEEIKDGMSFEIKYSDDFEDELTEEAAAADVMCDIVTRTTSKPNLNAESCDAAFSSENAAFPPSGPAVRARARACLGQDGAAARRRLDGARRVKRKGWDMFIAEPFKGKPAALHGRFRSASPRGAFAGCVYADVRSECNATELRIEVRARAHACA